MAPVAVSLVSHKALLNLINWWVALYSSIDGLPQVFHIGVLSDLTHYRWFDFIYMLDVDLIYVKAKIFCVGISSKQIWLQKSQWLRIYNWDYDFTRFVEAHRKVPHSVLSLDQLILCKYRMNIWRYVYLAIFRTHLSLECLISRSGRADSFFLTIT